MTLWKAFMHLQERDERGDVPGWVMITVMTIIIASSILVIFQTRVTSFLNDALDKYM
jgi:heme/copper-type cytochrome/quinol oxidase subunit 4